MLLSVKEKGKRDIDTKINEIKQQLNNRPNANKARPSGKLRGCGLILEITTEENQDLEIAAKEFDHVNYWRTTADTFLRKSNFKTSRDWIREAPGISIHGCLPYEPLVARTTSHRDPHAQWAMCDSC